MQSHFEINVAKDGKHFFATAPRSAVDAWDAQNIYEALVVKFPESEGYTVTCTHYRISGKTVDSFGS